jgi:peptide-N4-(N-acetyl-beta-glucosaminyl)asparagine amidase
VWVELWSPARSRWVHADACEGPGAFDTPLMYEAGWGKKLSFIIAVGEDHVVDVSRRYTRDFSSLLRHGRTAVLAEGPAARAVARQHRAQLRSVLAAERALPPAAARTAASAARRARRARLLFEQLALLDAARSETELAEAERQGRVSGDANWRRLRGEDGSRRE